MVQITNIRLRPVTRACALALSVAAGTTLIGPVADAQPAETSRVERVEITGSSIKRIQGETALPVQVLNSGDIVRSGASSVEQLLKTVTATSTLGGTREARI